MKRSTDQFSADCAFSLFVLFCQGDSLHWQFFSKSSTGLLCFGDRIGYKYRQTQCLHSPYVNSKCVRDHIVQLSDPCFCKWGQVGLGIHGLSTSKFSFAQAHAPTLQTNLIWNKRRNNSPSSCTQGRLLGLWVGNFPSCHIQLVYQRSQVPAQTHRQSSPRLCALSGTTTWHEIKKSVMLPRSRTISSTSISQPLSEP